MTNNLAENTRDSNPGGLRPIDHAKWYAGNCCECAKHFKLTDTVYRTFVPVGVSYSGRKRLFMLPLCWECSKPGPLAYDWGDCERCGRPVAYQRVDHTPAHDQRRHKRNLLIEAGESVSHGKRVHLFCSDRCASKTYHALNSAKRRRTVASAHRKICEVCGTTFEGRADAKTCGAKCRKRRSRTGILTPLSVTGP